MKQSYSSDSSGMAVCSINAKLISEVTGVSSSDFSRVQILDLHLKDDDNNKRGKIRKIENIGFLTPNVSQLNLSYNIIVQMEGFGRLHHLVELNLAENAIRKIENIEALTALERLNLSGNQIQRIPETITTLQRLTNFRIARNELDVVKDLQYLSRLMNLTKLRIDENPFSKFEHTRHFAIHCAKSLVYLDGYAVTQEERVSARTLFASTDISELRGRLSEELHKLSLLKSDVGKSPERRLASRSMELSRYGGNQFKETQSEVNEAHMILGQKLQRIADVEANVDLLKRQLDILASTPLKPTNDRSASPSIGAARNRRFGSPIPFRDTAPATNTAYLGDARSYSRYRDEGTPMTSRAYDPYDDDHMSPSMSTTPNHHPLRDRSIELDRNNNNNINNNNNKRVVRATSPSAEVATQQITQLNDRVEKLASKLVQVDREKSALESQLAMERDRRQESTTTTTSAAAAMDNHHVSILAEEVLQLRQQLQESDEALLRSKQEVSSVREELLTKSTELLSARVTVQKNDAVKESLKAELDTISAENIKIRNEMLDLRRTVVQSEEMVPPERLLSTTGFGGVGSSSSSSTFDQWKLHESRLDIAGKRVEIEELLRANEKLQKELEVLLFEVTAANEACLRATSEAEHYRNQAKAADDDHRKTMLRVNELERELHNKTKELTTMDQAREAIEQDKMHLQQAYSRLKEDMSSLMKARENTPMKRPVTPSGAVASRLSSMFRTNAFNDHEHTTGGAADNYYASTTYLLELVSTDSDESTIEARRHNKGKKNSTSSSRSRSRSALKKTAQSGQQRMDFTQLELAASEVIAHVLLQEVRTMERDHATANDSMKSLKEACIRAALRVVHSASMLQLDQVVAKSSADEDSMSSSREGIAESKSHDANTAADGTRRRKGVTQQSVDVDPFTVLGSREYLSKIVADVYAGLVTMEDSDAIKLEIAQLEKIIREQELKVQLLDGSIKTKSDALEALHKHCDDSKKKAQETLDELDFLTKRLQDGRDNITRTESELTISKRELDLTRHSLQETIAMSEIEHQNIHTVRSRITELKQEQSICEQHVLQSKELISKEDDKLRTTKTLVTDQLRFLQMDLNKIQSDFKAKVRTIEELEKNRRSIEEEIEIKRRDADNQLVITTREYEEEARKLTNAKSELRVQRLEVDQLTGKRRQLEAEVSRMQEILTTETGKYEALEMDARRKMEVLEKQVLNTEKRIREGKEKISAYEAEQTLLRQSVEELRRQQVDLDKATDTRRRAAEEELTRAQHQAQVAMRASRQAEGQAEQKQAELDTLLLGYRTSERRLDDIKRQIRDHEMQLDSRRDTMKGLDIDRERISKDQATIRKEEDALRHQSQILRSSIEHDTRTSEDLRRRLVVMKEEEASVRDSEMRLRSILVQTKKTLDDAQTELDAIRTTADREKRSIAEIRSKRASMEAEMMHLMDELKFSTERVNQENIVRMESEATILRCRDEASRAQKELGTIEKKISDALRREEDLKRSSAILKANLEKLRGESEGLSSVQVNERAMVSNARDELRDLHVEIKREKDNLKLIQQELQSNQINLEAIKTQNKHIEGLKDELSEELYRIRETNRMELRRTDKLESTYVEVEQRLKSLREELVLMEKDYERTRYLTLEEQERVSDQRRILRQTLDELTKAERAVSETYKQMYDERQKALVEISLLGQAKQSAQAHMFLTSEAQKKIDKNRDTVGEYASGSNNPVVVPMPNYLTSQVTNTLYRTSPSLSSTGIKIAPRSTYSDMSTYNNIAYKEENWKPKEIKVVPRSSSSMSMMDSSMPIIASNRQLSTIRTGRAVAPSVEGIVGGEPSFGATNRAFSRSVSPVGSQPTATIRAPVGQGPVSSSNTSNTSSSSSVPIIELSSLQREVEKLKMQSAAVLANL